MPPPTARRSRSSSRRGVDRGSGDAGQRRGPADVHRQVFGFAVLVAILVKAGLPRPRARSSAPGRRGSRRPYEPSTRTRRKRNPSGSRRSRRKLRLTLDQSQATRRAALGRIAPTEGPRPGRWPTRPPRSSASADRVEARIESLSATRTASIPAGETTTLTLQAADHLVQATMSRRPQEKAGGQSTLIQLEAHGVKKRDAGAGQALRRRAHIRDGDRRRGSTEEHDVLLLSAQGRLPPSTEGLPGDVRRQSRPGAARDEEAALVKIF